LGGGRLDQAVDTADFFGDFKPSIGQGGYAGGIIPPVLKAFQALEYDGGSFLLPDISDNSAHEIIGV
jgi:hypothetical protein